MSQVILRSTFKQQLVAKLSKKTIVSKINLEKMHENREINVIFAP